MLNRASLLWQQTACPSQHLSRLLRNSWSFAQAWRKSLHTFVPNGYLCFAFLLLFPVSRLCWFLFISVIFVYARIFSDLLLDYMLHTSMDEIPQPWMDLQPFTVGTKVAFISWSLAHSLIGAGAPFWSLEGGVWNVACICNLIVIPTGYTPRRSPVGVGVDLLPLCCSKHDFKISVTFCLSSVIILASEQPVAISCYLFMVSVTNQNWIVFIKETNNKINTSIHKITFPHRPVASAKLAAWYSWTYKKASDITRDSMRLKALLGST